MWVVIHPHRTEFSLSLSSFLVCCGLAREQQTVITDSSLPLGRTQLPDLIYQITEFEMMISSLALLLHVASLDNHSTISARSNFMDQ